MIDFIILFYMKTRRDTLTILADLLNNMMEPRRLTHLLYSSNLSYSQLVKYLKIVKEMGLIEEQTKPFHTFKITEDGQFFMDMMKKRIQARIPPTKST
jgi:predicted transcriptional regulator